MSKLVDKERLAKLAQALDARAKAAVAAEKERAEGIEAGLQAGIDAINNETTGILANAKKYTDGKISEVNQANEALAGRVDTLEDKDEELEAAIGTNRDGVAANKAAIDVLNGGADKAGSVAKAVADAKAELQGQIDTINAKDVEQDGAIEAAQQQADKGVQDAAAVAARATALEAKDVQHEGRLDGVEGRLDVLEGDGEGSVAKAVEDAASNLQGQVDTIKTEIGKKAAGEQAASGLYKYIDDADARDLAAAKKYADDKIAALVNGAPEAMDTLNELAQAISDHQGVYEAYVQTVSAELAKKVDKVEGSRLVAETEIAKFNAKAEVSDVTEALNEAKGYTDTEIGKVNTKNNQQDQAIAEAKAQADKGVQDAAAVAARATALEEADEEIKANVAANKAAIDVLNGGADKAGSVAKAVADAKAELQGKIDTINDKDVEQDGRLDDLEALVSGSDGIAQVKGDIAAIQTKNQEQDQAIAAAKAQADKGVEDAAAVAARATALEEADVQHEARLDAVEKVADDNKKAIAVLNGDASTAGSVDKKLADALAAYTDTEELKVMLGNVVNSLALSMEDNKLKLKLGGVEGITIHETSLDMATDADIDEIIEGLDA